MKALFRFAEWLAGWWLPLAFVLCITVFAGLSCIALWTVACYWLRQWGITA